LAGLAYYNWFAAAPNHVSLWLHAILVLVGMYATGLIIGGCVNLVLGLITKLITGNMFGNLNLYVLSYFISPVIAFLAAEPALRIASSI
jgi:antibiotic biosynthesis monooxygenase (ABM) superfamily enzyme